MQTAWRGLQQYLLRPLFLLVVFTTVVFAIGQASGRLALALLPVFEDELNTALKHAGVNVQGLEGGWSWINPRVSAARVNFNGGFASDITLELDVFNSIRHNRLLPRQLHAEHVFVDLLQTDAGWQLRGATGEPLDIELFPLLKHSGSLRAQVEVQMTNRAAQTSVNVLRVDLKNREALHFLTLELAATDADNESLLLQGWWQEAGSLKLELLGSVALPGALLGQPGVRLNVPRSFWQSDPLSGGGELRLELVQENNPQLNKMVKADIGAAFDWQEGVLTSRVQQLDVHVDEQLLTMGDIFAQARLDGSAVEASDNGTGTAEPQVRLWLSELDLTAISTFVNDNLQGFGAAWRWSRGLDVNGKLQNVHAFWDADLGLGYGASLSGVSMTGYRGAPSVNKVQGYLWGHNEGVAARLHGTGLDLHFPDLFTDTWRLEMLSGVLKARFVPGYFALRGSALQTRIGGAAVSGSFSLSRPQERYEQRVGLILNVDDTSMQQARSFVPYKIPDALTQWLEYGPQSGYISDAQFAYFGQVHRRPGLADRRLELRAELSNTVARYEPEWPLVSALNGRIHVAGDETRISVDSAVSEGLAIRGGTVVLLDGAAQADARLTVSGPTDAALNFVLQSPLRDTLGFITPNWQGQGDLDLETALLVPLREEAPPLQVDLKYELRDVGLDMPEYRIAVSDLVGQGQFSLPHDLTGSFSGRMFDHPLTVQAQHDADWIYLDMDGAATPAGVYGLLEQTDIGLLTGNLPFDSRLSLAMTDTLISNLALTSELQGTGVNLPAEFGKAEQTQADLELDVQFLSDYLSVRFRYDELHGWCHYGDELERGALGVREAPPMTSQEQQAIVVRGSLPRLVIEEWVGDTESAADSEPGFGVPWDWQLQQLDVGELAIGDLTYADVRMSGAQSAGDMFFMLRSDDLEGRVDIPATDILGLDFDLLRLPATEEPELLGDADLESLVPDPIDVEIGRSLPAAQVKVAELFLGEEAFGAWSMRIEPQPGRVWFREFNVDVNGLHIADGDLGWDLDANQSYFSGLATLDDLASTLPQWGYAAALETSAAEFTADVNWQGSPANVSLLGLAGNLSFSADDGRFLDVESGGGLRIFSLLNFSKIAKRISFDFSDVTREGLPFETIVADVNLQTGQLTLLDRMHVKSSSSDFQIAGSVDLEAGLLNNEMIVTLPVSDSLPWYGVYLGLANPLAGLGVIIGERVLRKPLEAFSSAKFEVRGTLDEPEVKFLGLWDQSLNQPVVAIEEAQSMPGAAADPADVDGVPQIEAEELTGELDDGA